MMQKRVAQLFSSIKKWTQIGLLGAKPAAIRKSLIGFRIEMRVESLILLVSAYFAAFCNASFWEAILSGYSMQEYFSWIYGVCIFVMLVGLQFILLAFIINRWTAKPIFALLMLLTAAATYFTEYYGVYFDTSMVRNVLSTDANEASEILAVDMWPHFLWNAAIPLLFLSRIRLVIEPLSKSWWIRPLTMVIAFIVVFSALLPVTQKIIPRMREQKEIRHLVTPGNYIVSLLRVTTEERNIAKKVRTKIGLDAHKVTSKEHQKPLFMIIVVGETVRSANWGLNGYSRQTTPLLAGLDVFNFSNMSACGTNTAVSVPCMFSYFGRGHYDEQKIRSTESVLHVLDRDGVRVLWRDNQSGCKGVCDGLEFQSMKDHKNSAICNKDGCFDEVLLNNLDEELVKTPGDFVIVLHQMGSHGPAYHLRYPEKFRHFTPTCMTSELASCTSEQIVNTYDNSIVYTDFVLAQAASYLSRHADSRRVAMLYVSDHGESLGEGGMYLHGLPYSIAPDTQTKVPMMIWMPERGGSGVNESCLRSRAMKPASHDNLFHTVLGFAGIATSIYNPTLDVMSGCKLIQAPA